MEKRCDSVDALMYAYYELMRKKEENKMLEKNKICIEFSMRSMMITHKPYQEDTEIDITGMIPGREILANNSFDIPCEVVMVPKKEFERLQAAVDINAEIAKEWEKNYDLLLKKTGFDTVESLVFYLTNVGQSNTLLEALASLRDRAKYTCDEWKDLNRKLQECEKDYISERDKIEALETENIDLKTKNTEYACKIQDLIDDSCGRKTVIESYKRDIEKWQEATGCETPDKAREHLSKLRDKGTHIVYLNDPLGIIAKWERVTGYDKPEDFLKWKANIEGIVEAWKLDTGCTYPGEAGRLLEKWKTLTKCETPEAAATWIVSYKKACERGNELAEGAAEREKEWQDATGCDTPEEVEKKLNHYKSRLGNAVQAASCAAKHLENITF